MAGGVHALAKARLLAELLDDIHPTDDFIKAIVDVRQISSHPAHNRRAVALINHHDDQHRREDSDSDQRHAPVEAEHRHQHRADKRGAAQHRRHDRDVEIADHLGIVGDARDQLTHRLRVERAERLAQRGIHHIGT